MPIDGALKRSTHEKLSEGGHRCEATNPLEFDHVLEVARGGEATVAGVRLLCRAHNQHAAERTFGAEFMRHKRAAAAEGRERVARPPTGSPLPGARATILPS